jgi:hypothetical protein
MLMKNALLGFSIWMCLVFARPLAAATDAELDQLFESIGMPQTIEIMQQEGLAHGRTLGGDMLSGGGGDSWAATVARIYDPVKMLQAVQQGFVAEFADADAAPLIVFFASEAGKEIVALELGARRAFMDAALEDAAREAYIAMIGSDDARLARIAEYVRLNDLIEYNVAGALNANYMFFTGITAGGALEMSDAEIIADVWSQEDTIRQDTDEWMFAYLMLAYRPLSDAQLDSYLALSLTASGKALNRALFAGFDRMYSDVSLALGLAIAARMAESDL